MRLATSILLALVSLLAARTELRAQRAPSPSPEWREFTRAFDSLAAAERDVGGSALLIRDGRVVARHHYGFADQAAGRRVDDASIFHWGSITKTLTAIAIMQLRDRGKLSLDDPVTRWIPELRQVSDPYGMTDSITIRMLLTHSAGYQGSTWPWRRGTAWEPFEPTTWEQLVAMMPWQRLLFRPGTRSQYSNPGILYLARIIERITGDAWQSYVQKNLLTPLRLERSYFGVTPYHLAADRSHNYVVRRDTSTKRDTLIDQGVDFDPGITIPNGGWNSPFDDLGTYLTFLVGAPRDTATARRWAFVLKRSTLEEMWKPTFPLAAPGDSIGLTFFVHDRDGTRLIGHTGSQAGFRSFVYFNPRTRDGIVVGFNTTNYAQRSTFGEVQALAWRLLAGATRD